MEKLSVRVVWSSGYSLKILTKSSTFILLSVPHMIRFTKSSILRSQKKSLNRYACPRTHYKSQYVETNCIIESRVSALPGLNYAHKRYGSRLGKKKGKERGGDMR